MRTGLTRRQFAIASSASVFAGLAAASAQAMQEQSPPPATKPAIQPAAQPATKPAAAFDKGPPLDLDLCRQVVGESHRDLEKVRKLVNADPELVNAVWDWGGGDFETPLGAAAHTGQNEIARFLLDGGARLDVFAAAMLGMLDVVKSAIAADPLVQYTLGPHGIPLWRHAEAGGDDAAAVLAYLEELRKADANTHDLPLSPRAVRRYVGLYSDGTTEVEIIDQSGRATWMSEGAAIPLAHRGNHRFSPVDTSQRTWLEFQYRNSRAQKVQITRDGKTFTAPRIA